MKSLMGSKLLCLALLSVLRSSGWASSDDALSKVSPGSLYGTMYLNQSLGVSLDLSGTRPQPPADNLAPFDPGGTNQTANQCSRPLFDNQIGASDHFVVMHFFVFNPSCFGKAKFPKKATSQEVQSFARVVVPALKGSPYIPDDGVDLNGTEADGHPIVIFTGRFSGSTGVANVSILSFVKAGDFWLVWGAVVKDSDTKLLQSSKLGLKFLNKD